MTGEEGAKPVRFALGTMTYEIDLANGGEALTEALAPFIAVARRPLAGRKSKASHVEFQAFESSAATPEAREFNRVVREWAKEQGIHVAARGAISHDVYDSYNAVH
jgi:hypothetical protein